MDIGNIPIMAALKKRMHWLNANQSVLSENIANADTPGFSAKELKKQDFSSLVNSFEGGSGSGGASSSTSAGQMKRTSNRHYGASSGSGGEIKTQNLKDGEKSLSGNSVVLEEEMLKLADNQMEHGMVVNLYKKNMQLLKIAMGKGRGR